MIWYFWVFGEPGKGFRTILKNKIKRAINFYTVVRSMSRGQWLWGYWQSVTCWNHSLFTQKWIMGWVYLICGLCSPKLFQGTDTIVSSSRVLLRNEGPAPSLRLTCCSVFQLHPEKWRASGKELIWSSFLCRCCLFVTHCFSGGPQSKSHIFIGGVNFVLIFHALPAVLFFKFCHNF